MKNLSLLMKVPLFLDIVNDFWVVHVTSKNHRMLPWLRSRAMLALSLLGPTVIMYSVLHYHGSSSFVPFFQATLFRSQTCLIANFLALSLYCSSSMEDYNSKKLLDATLFIERHGYSAATYSLLGQIFRYLGYATLDPRKRALFRILFVILSLLGKHWTFMQGPRTLR
jgi:hypothetical protein